MKLFLLALLAIPAFAQTVTMTPVSVEGRSYEVWSSYIRPNCPPPDFIERNGCIPNKIGVSLARFHVVELGRTTPHVWGPDENSWQIGRDFTGDAGMPPEAAVFIAYSKSERKQ